MKTTKMLLGALAMCALAACSSAEKETTTQPSNAPAGAGAGAGTSASTPSSAADSKSDATAQSAKEKFGGTGASKGQTGHLLYKFVEPTNEAFVPYIDTVVKGELLTTTMAVIDKTITFPNDVTATVEGCDGTVNAFYRPSTHDIHICYELIDAIHTQFTTVAFAEDDAEKQLAITSAALAFMMVHEVGHAFLGENGIAVLGNQEDVVDDFSGVFFIAAEAPAIPIYGGRSMRTLFPNTPASNEHSMSEQRYFNMLCLVLGSSPDKYASVLVGSEADGLLPQERAVRCPSEWNTKQAALATLVGPYVRK